MKATPLLALAAIVLAAGCGDKSGTGSGTNAASPSPASAPADYVGALGKAQQNAIKTADTASINQAIDAFRAEKGRNPKDLNELVQEKYLRQLPAPPNGMKFDYDPNTGQFKVVPK